MDREHLEAVVWQQCPRATTAAVDAILAAAERYALDTYGITADRRRELQAAVYTWRRRGAA